MKLVVDAVIGHGAAVRELRLRAADGAPLPAWSAGAHLALTLPDADAGTLVRHYSLVGDPAASTHYRIAVLREDHGRASVHLHERVRAGDLIEADGPFNGFPVRPGAAHAVLVAGGIGVTPLVSIAQALVRAGVDCEFHYLVGTRERAALLPELQAIAGLKVVLHASGERGARADLAALLGPHRANGQLYACGPAALLAALRAQAAALGWPPAAVLMESFGARGGARDGPLTVRLAQSDLTLDVAPGTSILDALIGAGVFAAYDCKRGECGNCYTQVTRGIPIHRDVCLTPPQRALGMCTCVSWAADGPLELDL